MLSTHSSLQDIARSLKAARVAMGLSQRALSKRAGLTQAQVSNVENGADMLLSNVVELARALDLEVTLVPRKLMPAFESILRAASADLAPRTEPAYSLDADAVDG